jgi:hypothetical protein
LVRSSAEGDEGIARGTTHGSDVADAPAEGFPADPERAGIGFEVDFFHNAIRFQNQGSILIIAMGDQSSIVPWSRNGPAGLGKSSRQAPYDLVLP